MTDSGIVKTARGKSPVGNKTWRDHEIGGMTIFYGIISPTGEGRSMSYNGRKTKV